MKNVFRALTALALLLALAGCGATAASGQPSATDTSTPALQCQATQTITFDSYLFPYSCVQVIVNQPVTFDNLESSHTYFHFCLGDGSVCETNPSVSKNLQDPGFELDPGKKEIVVFTTPGTYYVTQIGKDAYGTMQIVVK
jgi:hypothetical protein